MVLEVRLQSWMALHKFSLVHQGGIFANLFADLTMFIKESVKISRFPAFGITVLSAVIPIAIPIARIAIFSISIGIAISCVVITISSAADIAVACIRIASIEILQPHERVGLLTDLLFHTWMVLQILVQLRMALQELRVVHQSRRSPKLFGIFAMAIQELIESRQVPACDVIVLCNLPVLRGRRLRAGWTG
jgi:hypothetical protein